MTRFWRGSIIIALAEAALVGSILLAPGAGHSPFLYSQLPALIVVAKLDPFVGSCISCAPLPWTIGIFSQTLLLLALWALVDRLLRARGPAGR